MSKVANIGTTKNVYPEPSTLCSLYGAAPDTASYGGPRARERSWHVLGSEHSYTTAVG